MHRYIKDYLSERKIKDGDNEIVLSSNHQSLRNQICFVALLTWYSVVFVKHLYLPIIVYSFVSKSEKKLFSSQIMVR